MCAFITSCSFFIKEEKQKLIDIDAPTIRYKTIFKKDLDPTLREHLKRASILRRLETHPPLTPFALEKRAEKDVKEMYETLEIYGYFEGKVSFNLKKETEDYYSVTFDITPGPLYTFSGFDIAYEDRTPSTLLNINELDIPLKKGDVVNLDKALDLGKKIAKYWRTKGYPFARAREMKGVRDKNLKTIHLIFTINLGPKRTFGRTHIEGLTHLDRIFVENRLDYKEGDLYNENLLDDTRKTLIETGLFNEIILQPESIDAPKLNYQNHASLPPSNDPTSATNTKKINDGTDVIIVEKNPIQLKLKEGPPRSIGAGAKYSSTYGLSGRAFWRHDNVFGGGESVEIRFIVGKRKNEAKVGFSKPDFGMKRQTLISSIGLTEEVTRAYRSRSEKIALGFSYDVTKKLKLNYAAEYEILNVTRNRFKSHANLFDIPLIGEYDSTNHILNPTEGCKVRIKTNPYFARYGNRQGFWVNEAFGSTYFHPRKIQAFEEADNIFVMATWAKYGVISSSSTDNVPPPKRFFSGGGNSVRGYGFQLLGPFDAYATPIGGLSVLEFGSEARFALTEKLGAVAFLEAGSIGLRHAPKLNKDNLLWGAGIGVRYFTGIGPIRFDLAFPMKRRVDPTSPRRKRFDAPFQFYISVGQAF